MLAAAASQGREGSLSDLLNYIGVDEELMNVSICSFINIDIKRKYLRDSNNTFSLYHLQEFMEMMRQHISNRLQTESSQQHKQ